MCIRDSHGEAPVGRGPGTRKEVLLLWEPGVPEVGVEVHEGGEEELPPRREKGDTLWGRDLLGDLLDDSPRNQNIAGHLPAGVHDPRALYKKIAHTLTRSPQKWHWYSLFSLSTSVKMGS